MKDQKLEDFADIRDAVRSLCAGFPGEYWREKDREQQYPNEFVHALTEAGFLSCLIPEEYGGSGLGISEASAVMEEVQAAGCNGGACHAQMYTMGTVLRYGSEDQKQMLLPGISSGELRLQEFGVTEPTSGTDTSRIRTTAVKEKDTYRINGQKVWTSRIAHSDFMLLLARTAPRDAGEKPYHGMSVFLVDIREAQGNGLTIKPLRAMINHATTEVFFDDLIIPASSLVGEEGKGFKYLLHSLNPERVLIGAEAIGIGQNALHRATEYAKDREVFDRPIGQNQSIQHPLAKSWMELEAAFLMTMKAASLYDNGVSCGVEANWLNIWPPKQAFNLVLAL